MSPTTVAVLAIIASVLSTTSIIMHIVRPNSAITSKLDELGALVKKLSTGALVLLVLGAVGCTAPTRAETIHTTFVSLNAARAAFDSYDAAHQADIVKQAPDAATSTKELAAWEATAAKIAHAFDAAFDAVKVAQELNDDHSLAGMAAAAMEAIADVSKLGVSP